MPGQLSARVLRVAAGSAAGLVVGLSVATAAPASAAVDHCATYAVGGTDPNGFPVASPQSFAADCLDHLGQDVAQQEAGPHGHVSLGGPGSWTAAVRTAGLGASSTAARGRVIEVAAGRTSTVTGAGGVPENLDGPYLGVVVGGTATRPVFRVYDAAAHEVDTWQLTYDNSGSPTYLDLTGGHRYVAPAPARTTAAPAPTSSAAVAGPTTVPPSITAPAASPTTTAPPPTVADAVPTTPRRTRPTRAT